MMLYHCLIMFLQIFSINWKYKNQRAHNLIVLSSFTTINTTGITQRACSEILFILDRRELILLDKNYFNSYKILPWKRSIIVIC